VGIARIMQWNHGHSYYHLTACSYPTSLDVCIAFINISLGAVPYRVGQPTTRVARGGATQRTACVNLSGLLRLACLRLDIFMIGCDRL